MAGIFIGYYLTESSNWQLKLQKERDNSIQLKNLIAIIEV